MGKKENMGSEKRSQAAQLRRLVRQAIASVAVGAVLLLGFIIFNMGMSSIQAAQINTTVALNQYRTASKTLTYDIQSYAVTGDQSYYDGYMKELNEDKNREQALATLEKCSPIVGLVVLTTGTLSVGVSAFTFVFPNTNPAETVATANAIAHQFLPSLYNL